MDIYNYIDEYGKYSFNEKKINEVDKVIFSFLSYANLEKIFVDVYEMTIKEAGDKYLGIYRGKDKNIVAVKEANKILKSIRNTKRYRECVLSHYEYIADSDIQFGVVSIEYIPGEVYISFEGTDSMFSGWKENFMLGLKFPTVSHKKAISYLNKHYTFSNKKLIVGGHSKGGNLALVGSMYANFLVRSKIKEIINADGPGLLDSEFKSSRYKKILPKYIHIIPNYSLIGLFLNNSNNYVVYSTNKGILAHNIVYWEIDNDEFIKTDLSSFSKELDKRIQVWFNKYSREDKIDFINNLNKLLDSAEVESILEVKEKKRKLFDLIYKSKDMNTHTKNVLKDFFMIIIKSFGDVKKEELKGFITNMFKI